MRSHTQLVVRGESGHLVVPIGVIPAITIGAFTYFRDHLPEFCIQNAEKVIAVSGILTLILLMVAWFRKSRYLEYASGRLRYRSWLTEKVIPAGRITDVTFETEHWGGDDQIVTEHYLSVWSGDSLLLRLNSQLWPREGLAGLLRALRDQNPAVRTDRSVEHYLGEPADRVV